MLQLNAYKSAVLRKNQFRCVTAPCVPWQKLQSMWYHFPFKWLTNVWFFKFNVFILFNTLSTKAEFIFLPWHVKQKLECFHLPSLHFESAPTTHLYDVGLANMLCGGGAVEHSVAVRSPLDVAQPAWPVGVAHQVGIERDRVIAGITCGQSGLMRGSPNDLVWVRTNSVMYI